MLNKIPPRERQIVDLLYQRGALAVTDICDALPDTLSGSAVRAMLKRLEDKGYVQRSESDRGYLYSPVVSDSVARKKSALSDVVRVSSTARRRAPPRPCSACPTSSTSERARRARADDRPAREAKGGK